MDILKYIPELRGEWSAKHGRALNPEFCQAVEILNEIGELFKEQGAMDSASGIAPRFDEVYRTIVLEVPNAITKLAALMKRCYEEGYHESV